MINQETDVMIDTLIQSVLTVIPSSQTEGLPSVQSSPILQEEMGVLIGFTGQLRGRIVLEGPIATFQGVGEMMFGMQMDVNMLESFVGEVGNMLAGTAATMLSQQGKTIEITPPTVIVGQSKLSGFPSMIQLVFQLKENRPFHLLFTIEED